MIDGEAWWKSLEPDLRATHKPNFMRLADVFARMRILGGTFEVVSGVSWLGERADAAKRERDVLYRKLANDYGMEAGAIRRRLNQLWREKRCIEAVEGALGSVAKGTKEWCLLRLLLLQPNLPRLMCERQIRRIIFLDMSPRMSAPSSSPSGLGPQTEPDADEAAAEEDRRERPDRDSAA